LAPGRETARPAPQKLSSRVFAEIYEEMFSDTNFPSAVYQRMMLFRERLLDPYKAGAPYVLEGDELRFLADNLKRLCDVVPDGEAEA
jgi:hypothetical protein